MVFCFNEYLSKLRLPQQEIVRSTTGHGDVSLRVFKHQPKPYFSIQIDVMNALHYRGDSGERGTTIVDIVTSKMKSNCDHGLLDTAHVT